MSLGRTKNIVLGISLASVAAAGGVTTKYLYGRTGVASQQTGGGNNNLVLLQVGENSPQHVEREVVLRDGNSLKRVEEVEEDKADAFNDDDDSAPAFNQLEVVVDDQEEVEEEDPKEVAKRKRREEEARKEQEEIQQLIRDWEKRLNSRHGRKERLDAKEKEERENIWLEVAWIFDVIDTGRQKMCSLIRKNEDKIVPIVINDHDNFRVFREKCDKTTWSRRRRKESRAFRDRFHIRGDHDAVKKTIWNNWDDIKDFRWTKEKKKPHLVVSDNLSELKEENCKIKREGNWTEITCLNRR